MALAGKRVPRAPRDTGPPRVRREEGHPAQVERGHWQDPAGDTAPEVYGWRTACVLRKMARRDGSRIKEEHLAAVQMIRVSWDVGTYGLTPGGAGLKLSGGDAVAAGPSAGPSAASEHQVEEWRNFRRAAAVVPLGLAELFAWVVVQNRDVTSWCARMDRLHHPRRHDRNVETGRLLVLLDLLAEHYDGKIRMARMLGNLPA